MSNYPLANPFPSNLGVEMKGTHAPKRRAPGAGRKKVGPRYQIALPPGLKAALLRIGAPKVREALEELRQSERHLYI